MVSKALRHGFNSATSVEEGGRCVSWGSLLGQQCRNHVPLLVSRSVLSYLLVYSRKREAVGGSDFSRGFVFASN